MMSCYCLNYKIFHIFHLLKICSFLFNILSQLIFLLNRSKKYTNEYFQYEYLKFDYGKNNDAPDVLINCHSIISGSDDTLFPLLQM